MTSFTLFILIFMSGVNVPPDIYKDKNAYPTEEACKENGRMKGQWIANQTGLPVGFFCREELEA